MRLMLFGDSELAAVIAGLGLVRLPEDLELHLWGAPGPLFAQTVWHGGKVMPTSDSAAEAFAEINSDGLRELDPAQYDAVAFVGAALRPGDVVPELLNHIAHPDRHLSRPYMQLVLAEHYLGCPAYQIARAMAASGKTRVLLAMTALDTAGLKRPSRHLARARDATADDLGQLWALTGDLLTQDGITFVPQPLETVVEGYHTDARYGLEGDAAGHKNAEFGALMLEAILRRL